MSPRHDREIEARCPGAVPAATLSRGRAILRGRSHMRGVRPDLPEWADGLDQVHKLALIDAMERLDAGIKQFGWKDVSLLMRDHGIPETPVAERIESS